MLNFPLDTLRLYKYNLNMKANITEKDLLTDFESVSEELKQYIAADPYLKEYEEEIKGLKEKGTFFVVPASFTYIISSIHYTLPSFSL